jgi:hypothetical protein
VSDLAEATPLSRLRHLDFLRALAIVAVVLGHWFLMTVARLPDGGLTGYNALPLLEDFWWLTWLFQVMPLFFFVGGAGNGISWGRRRDDGVAAWLLGRSGRLFPPVTLLLGAMLLGVVVAQWLAVDERFLAEAVGVIILPLWFLVVYIAVIVLTPVMCWLHRRCGAGVLGVMIAAVALLDIPRVALGVEAWGYANYAFGWLVIYQAGIVWGEIAGGDSSKIRIRVHPAVLFLGSLAMLVLLTVVGPYPVPMVAVPQTTINNPSPPTLAFLALAGVQVGFAAWVAGPVDRWLTRSRFAWRATIAVNAVVMTLFLWHMVAAFLAALVMVGVGWLPDSDVGTSGWWLGRLPWMAAIAVVMAGLLVTVGRWEARGLRRGGVRRGRVRRGPGSVRRGGQPIPDSTTPERDHPAHLRRGPGSVPLSRSGPGSLTQSGVLGEQTGPTAFGTEKSGPTTARDWAGRVLTSTPVVSAAYVTAALGMMWQNSVGLGPHGPFMVPTGALILVFAAATVLWLGRLCVGRSGIIPRVRR